MPPKGPSLHPPMNVPPIQIAGTDVLPTISAISALMGFPSSSISSSKTVYLIFFSSNIALALMQKGQVVKLIIRTGSFSIQEFNLFRTATWSYLPAKDFTNAIFALFSDEFVRNCWTLSAKDAMNVLVGSFEYRVVVKCRERIFERGLNPSMVLLRDDVMSTATSVNIDEETLIFLRIALSYVQKVEPDSPTLVSQAVLVRNFGNVVDIFEVLGSA